jgi:GH24 family phage-related lysozyme (muramidase)
MLIRLADEVERLREVIRRIAGQDCTVSICRGNVTVTLDATLTEEEREALNNAARWLVAIQSADDPRAGECAATLRGLLQRHGGGA